MFTRGLIHFHLLVLGLAGLLLLVCVPRTLAQTDEVTAPEITHPAIRKIIQSRSGRVRALNRFKAAAALGKNNKALVEVRQLDSVPMSERRGLKQLVRAENADRERMFKAIAAATDTDLSQLPKIRSTYATTLRQKARRGD